MAKNDILNLKEVDLWSLLLFVLYKLRDINEMSTISEMAYLLPKESILTLCQYYGGELIRVPTIEEMGDVLNVLSLYNKVDIEKDSIENAMQEIGIKNKKHDDILALYNKVKTILETYEFKPRT